MQTGNFAELEHEEIPVPLERPDHLSFASERLLRRVLERAGYTLLAFRSYPMYPAPKRRSLVRQKKVSPSADRQALDLWLRARFVK